MTSSGDHGHEEPSRPVDRPVDRQRERAELMESSSMANLVAVAGLGALLLAPLAWVLVKLKRALRRR